MEKILEIAILLIILTIFSFFSYKKKALDREGLLIGNIIGILSYILGSLTHFLIMVFFFVTAELCTRYARKKFGNHHGKRTTGNVLGNSGAAILALGFNVEMAFFGAISAALADTLSSEIGLLSKKKPLLITTFKEVEHGTDGGITVLGLLASILGGLLIAIIHYFLNQNLFVAGIIVLAGFMGSIGDSFFGAVFESKGILNNAEVNFIGGSIGALTAYIFTMF